MQLRSVKSITSDGTGQMGGGDVLINARDPLVCYDVHANDIYAWFRMAVSDGVMSGVAFSTTQDQAQAIADFAKGQGNTIANIDASTMELKTAWLLANSVEDKSQFVLGEGTFPTYDKTDPALWTVSGSESVQLALVGIHIVAPVLDHPELVWISFEHISNAPMAEYIYTSTSGDQATMPYSAMGSWPSMSKRTGNPQPSNRTPRNRATGASMRSRWRSGIPGAFHPEVTGRRRTTPISSRSMSMCSGI